MENLIVARLAFNFLTIVCCGHLAGCGLAPPKINEVWDRDIPASNGRGPLSATTQIEFEVKKRIYCDLRKAVQSIEGESVKVKLRGNKKIYTPKPIPEDWGAQVSVLLQVDESSALNPGVSLNTPLATAMSHFVGRPDVATPQSFALGFGGTLSSASTRVDKFDSFYSIKYLNIPDRPMSVCKPENDPLIAEYHLPADSSPFILESDLGIEDWLKGAMFGQTAIPSVSTDKDISSFSTPGGFQPDTVSLELKFIIVSNGNITPTWKLVRVSANTSGPLFATGRTRTHDVIITIGPPKQETLYTHLASQIGQASKSP